MASEEGTRLEVDFGTTEITLPPGTKIENIVAKLPWLFPCISIIRTEQLESKIVVYTKINKEYFDTIEEKENQYKSEIASNSAELIIKREEIEQNNIMIKELRNKMGIYEEKYSKMKDIIKCLKKEKNSMNSREEEILNIREYLDGKNSIGLHEKIEKAREDLVHKSESLNQIVMENISHIKKIYFLEQKILDVSRQLSYNTTNKFMTEIKIKLSNFLPHLDQSIIKYLPIAKIFERIGESDNQGQFNTGFKTIFESLANQYFFENRITICKKSDATEMRGILEKYTQIADENPFMLLELFNSDDLYCLSSFTKLTPQIMLNQIIQ